MSNLGDMNKLMKDMMGNFPFDTIAIEKAVKKSASLHEKLANLALDAAGTSTEISTSWANETLDKFRVTAEAKDELVPGTNCLMLSQLLAASQWGVTLMWQKKLISLDTFRHQAILKHCVDLMPFCQTDTKDWLQKLLQSTMKEACNDKKAAWIDETRMAS